MKKQAQKSSTQQVSSWQIASVALGLLVVAALLGAVGWWTQSLLPDGHARLAALDVGQGDALLWRGAGGTTMLMDGGPDDSLLWQAADELPFFDRTIDLLVVTHPHADHFTGFLDFLDRYNVRQVLISPVLGGDAGWDSFLAKVEEQEIPVTLAGADTDFCLDAQTTLDVLFPFTPDPFRARNQNNASIVARLEHCPAETDCTSILLMGDAEEEVEELLLQNYPDLKSDILKVGHHGSPSSSGTGFLAAVDSDIAIISVGADNSFGHPSVEVIDRLSALGAQIWRTDQDGTVRLTF